MLALKYVEPLYVEQLLCALRLHGTDVLHMRISICSVVFYGLVSFLCMGYKSGILGFSLFGLPM